MNDIEAQRIQAVLQFRLDGAERWDVAETVAGKERDAEAPWTVEPGGKPLSAAEIDDLIDAADRLICQSAPGFPPSVARLIGMRRNLYARAVQAGEIATAARILRDIESIEKNQAAGEDGQAELAPTKRRLLAEVHRRHLAVADEPNPSPDLFEFGPLFSAAQWFQCQADATARMRWTRAMRDLVAAGLVIANQTDGCRWANVRLSPAGESMLAACSEEKDGHQ